MRVILLVSKSGTSPPPHFLYSDYVCLSYHFRASLLWIKSFLFLIKMPTDLLYLVETSSINKGGGECATFWNQKLTCMISAHKRVITLKFGTAVAFLENNMELWRNGSGSAAPAANRRIFFAFFRRIYFNCLLWREKAKEFGGRRRERRFRRRFFTVPYYSTQKQLLCRILEL